MASNPYDADPIMKRAAILDELGPKTLGPKPGMNTTLPVGEAPANPNLASASPVSGGRRDQWSGAGTVTGGDFSRLAGFDQNKFNGDEQTAKYQNAHFFGRYDPSGGVSQLFNDPEFVRMFPNAKAVGDDKIDYGDGFPVDVIQGYGAPGAMWAWQTSNPADQQAPGVSAPAMTGGGSNLASIMQEIQALSQGTESPSKRRAVLDLLMDPSAQQTAI